MKKLIVANWKMNPQTHGEAERLASAVSKLALKFKGVETVLCLPFVWLADLSQKYADKIEFGSQDVFWENPSAGGGAFTGEISPAMLKNSKVKYAIIGHSERRRHLGETDEMINKKVRAALKNGLRAILCVGETFQEHKKGATQFALRRQLRKDLEGISKFRDRLAVAYEPVWAIGTGVPETPQNAEAAAMFIRSEISKLMPRRVAGGVRIIYGGSVNSRNIGGYLAMPSISGALVGGASLDAKDFGKILKIANNV